MFTLIIGGAASGKSEYAEALVKTLPGKRWYVATMEPYGVEGKARIARHRAARAGGGFTTVERYYALQGLRLPAEGNVLLECLGNLVANELYGPKAGGADRALIGVETLAKTCQNLTVVTNEVFSGGREYAGDTLTYLRELARLNRVLAREADRVIEVVCGLPVILKGESL